MRHIYAFETIEEYSKHQNRIKHFSEKLKWYQEILEKEFSLKDPPKAVVWTTDELATEIFSSNPIAAFTNKDNIYISPDIMYWKRFFVQQLNEKSIPDIKSFYETLSENQFFTILAHELTHHLDLFLDEFEDNRASGIWFEEGMCDYLSRKLTLTEEEFKVISEVESTLVAAFQSEYSHLTLNDFGAQTYEGSLSSIMYQYWRSFLAIKYLVEEQFNHDIHQVFTSYHEWDKEGRSVPLTEYLGITTNQ